MGSIRVGTSGWSYADWDGVFYPAGTASKDYLSYLSRRMDIVEVDSTYYRIPSRRMVTGWFEKTPEDFQFAVKTPSVITHDKVLRDCDDERDAFLDALEPLGHKLHSILLQFGYFNKRLIPKPEVFFQRLDTFLQGMPPGRRLAVEIRNKSWLGKELFQLLRGHGVSYVLADHVWMPPIERVLETHDCVTGDFVYVRLMGDRKGIEEVTKSWHRVVIDRRERIASIVRALTGLIPSCEIVAFVNNHYAGHAPANVQDFLDALGKEGVGRSG